MQKIVMVFIFLCTRVQLPRAADVAKIRQNLDLTQDEFADFMRVKVKPTKLGAKTSRTPRTG